MITLVLPYTPKEGSNLPKLGTEIGLEKEEVPNFFVFAPFFNKVVNYHELPTYALYSKTFTAELLYHWAQYMVHDIEVGYYEGQI